MIWETKNLNKAVFEYRGIRQLNIIHNNKEYIIEIIAYSLGKNECSTEIWLTGKNDKLKFNTKIVNQQVSDRECLSIISNELNSWVFDYESIIEKHIFY